MNTKILLADDHKIMRQGLRSLIENQSDMEVVGEAEDGRTTIRLVEKLSPHVVIMDIAMPNLNGIEATRQITGNEPRVKVIALSMYLDRRFVTEILRAGATGYVLKDCAFDELVQAIHTVITNQIYLSSKVTSIMVQDYIQYSKITNPSAFSVLTTRERELLQLLAEGRNTKEIARQLYVSAKTIETHRRKIMKKLDIYNIAELTKYAIREGMTFLDI